ncbi:MAG: class I SAM-dependent methyltransferase, partial [Bacteroidota bacterium]
FTIISSMDNPAIFSGQRAFNYDNFVQAYIPYYQSLQNLLPKLIAGKMPVSDAPILVAGSGTGAELLSLANRHPNWILEGIDPSPEMVVQARDKLRNYNNVRLMEGYVSDLPLEPHYRAATLLLVLHFVPDDGAKSSLLKELANRMLPGAPLVILDIFGSTTELAQNLEVLRAMMPPVADPEAVDNRLRTLPDRIEHVPEERLYELLLNNGFSIPQRFFQAAIYGGWISKKL